MNNNNPIVDVQDPLPESNWTWRRVFVFVVMLILLFFVWGAVDRLGKVAVLEPARGIPALVSVTKSILFLALVLATYYLLAPSAEQLTRLVKTASLLKGGVSVGGKQKPRPPVAAPAPKPEVTSKESGTEIME